MMQIHPEQIARTLIKEAFISRRVVVGAFVLVNAALLATGLTWPKYYAASTNILVEDRNIIQPLMQGVAVATDVSDLTRNAREVIYGRRIMDRILEHGGWLDRHPSAVEQESLIDQIKKRTTISIVGKNLIKVEYRDTNPERAFHVTQKFAELVIQEGAATRTAETRAAYDFIDKQAREYEARLTRSEQETRQLRGSNLDARPVNEVELSARLAALNARIEATTMELREAEIKRSSLERQVSGEAEVTAGITREGQIRSRIGELQTKLDTLRLSYLDTHPDIVQLKLQIQDLTKALDSERQRPNQGERPGRKEMSESAMNSPIYQQLRRELSQNQVTVEALKARISESQRLIREEAQRGKGLRSGDTRLSELARDSQINREIYQDLLRRREKARVSMSLDDDRQGLTFSIQEPATLPQAPKGPRFWHFVLGGLVLGLLVPFALLYARMQVDPRIRIPDAISKLHNVPVLATIPHLWTPDELKQLRAEFPVLKVALVSTVAVCAILSVLRMVQAL
jgi:polysaccharide chain length determinant protein (PEP-CTERM system associated)